MTTDTTMLRYAAHLPLKGVGEAGQQRIRDAHVALVGLGGLGCAAAQYLASSGIGALTLCDYDTVAESNLSRQILYHAGDIGRHKTEAAAEALTGLNPQSDLHTVTKRMHVADMLELFPGCDLVIDCSDNYGTRLAANRSCLELQKPWIMASCIRMEGQLLLLRPDQPEQACYRCVYGSAPDTLEDCPGAGVFAPVAGIIGASAAHFALAHLAGMDMPGGLHVFDGVNWSWRTLTTRKKPDCQVCGEP
ncbi:MAG: HesA/MoeB/ThiF family protein [Xanthomonadales bacterium]|nr:HesA/MoeB/ThiF family protein [Xanthomonadales bacterium]